MTRGQFTRYNFDQPPGSQGWIVKLDPQSGEILGHLDVPEERGGHALEVTPSGDLLITLGDELFWFEKSEVGSLYFAEIEHYSHAL